MAQRKKTARRAGSQRRAGPGVTIGPQGRIVIPKELRARMGLKPGDELDADVEGGALVLRPRTRTVSELQILFKDLRGSLADELSEERRRQAADLGA